MKRQVTLDSSSQNYGINYHQRIFTLGNSIIAFCCFMLLWLSLSSCDPCNKTNCQNGGFCEDGTCQCPDGFYGDNCELQRAPIASFTANKTTIIAGESITFTDRSTSNPQRWQWTFPGGTPSSHNGQIPPAIVYKKAGKYLASLSVTNNGGTHSSNLSISVNIPPTQIAYDRLVAGGLEGRFPDANSRMKVRFARYAVKSDGTDLHLVAREGGGWQALAPTDMIAKLNVHGSTLNPATWVGEDGKWVVVYSSYGYASSGLPANFLSEMGKANANKEPFIRIDRDSEGNFVLLTNNRFYGSSIAAFNTAVGQKASIFSFENIRGFAFGSNQSWALITSDDYVTSSNAPSSLISKLAQLKREGKEFVDIEIGSLGWILVYR